MEKMNLTEYMQKQYENRPDKDNIFCVGISDAEFRQFMIKYLLGDDWYVVDPLGQTQINEIALYEILDKYSKRYRKERRTTARELRRVVRKRKVLNKLSKWLDKICGE